MDFQRPRAEVSVDVDLVRALLADQHADLADLELALLDEGWDNFTFRAGPRYAVRVPRRQSAVALTRSEQRWLPFLAERLPLPIPEPVRLGGASERFPWPWTVVTWIPGSTVDRTPLGPEESTRLADFLLALHRPAPPEAPANPYRGLPLAARSPIVEKRLERLPMPELKPIWDEALRAPRAADRRWLHGDLHPRNVLAVDGELAGIIDWGDLNGGDVATDLACAWMMFSRPRDREKLFAAYGASDAMITRAAGWAVNFASAIVERGSDGMAATARATRDRLLADFGP